MNLCVHAFSHGVMGVTFLSVLANNSTMHICTDVLIQIRSLRLLLFFTFYIVYLDSCRLSIWFSVRLSSFFMFFFVNIYWSGRLFVCRSHFSYLSIALILRTSCPCLLSIMDSINKLQYFPPILNYFAKRKSAK